MQVDPGRNLVQGRRFLIKIHPDRDSQNKCQGNADEVAQARSNLTRMPFERNKK
jgi:hypothetical protein